ncbi:hypothetical protein ABZ733_17125, partial [Streptomyces longwoodensis]
MGRGGPAQRRGLPARPGLARGRGGRLPGAGDLAPALPVRRHRRHRAAPAAPHPHGPARPCGPVPPVVTHLARRLEAPMSTTTAHTPEPGGAAEGPPRPVRLIKNEATTEIPVHLLFRDEPDPRPVPLAPTVVSRRQGTGEQPRLRRPAPAATQDLFIVERPDGTEVMIPF